MSEIQKKVIAQIKAEIESFGFEALTVAEWANTGKISIQEAGNVQELAKVDYNFQDASYRLSLTTLGKPVVRTEYEAWIRNGNNTYLIQVGNNDKEDFDKFLEGLEEQLIKLKFDLGYAKSANMTEDLKLFCEIMHLPLKSADELLNSEKLTNQQASYLIDFCNRWEEKQESILDADAERESIREFSEKFSEKIGLPAPMRIIVLSILEELSKKENLDDFILAAKGPVSEMTQSGPKPR